MNNGRRFPYLPALQPPGAPDADLLARWVAHRDEAAFELLVRRHTPAVLAACRRLLTDPNDADDAFQAVFLVLARKAASVARGEVLGAWLHRVACRAALRLRAESAKRTDRQESDSVDQLPAPVPADPAWAELLVVLDEEVERLPARHRVVFVLCCLEGKTGEEAGRLLGCPSGTVSSRLTRARERLRDRLTRRGFAPAALLVAALTGDALAAFVPNTLVASVMRVAPPFSGARPHAGPAVRSTAIAEGVLKAMLVQQLKLTSGLFAAGLLAVGAVLAGTGTDRAGNPNPPLPAPKVAADGKAVKQKGTPAAPGVRPLSAASTDAKGDPPAKAGDAEDALKKQVLDTARVVYEAEIKRYQAGGSVPVESLYRWSHRWLEGELDAAAEASARTAALKAHLDRMKEVEKLAGALVKVGQVSASDGAAGRYYRAQAELWVARGRAR